MALLAPPPHNIINKDDVSYWLQMGLVGMGGAILITVPSLQQKFITTTLTGIRRPSWEVSEQSSWALFDAGLVHTQQAVGLDTRN